ncbi:MAG TPA: RES domain-containing protein [Gammaproteobacteria bacterium]|nr:RES domain-containing protein [Gammaproteobacteria bacterium]
MSRIGFRHVDSRYPFVRNDADQPAARWHAEGTGPANSFADTPAGAWAEFLRHEEIRDAADLPGIARSLWAVELPETAYASPALPPSVLEGDRSSYPACRAEAASLRARGAERIEAPSAALLPGGARGWIANPVQHEAPGARNGLVWILFGDASHLVGWPAVESGSPPARVLPLVRHFPSSRLR